MKLGAVILAAGMGARLGGRAKALLGLGDETYLARIARIARLGGLREGVVVVGPPFGVTVGELARELGFAVIVNPTPERGMASSVALGFEALGSYDLDAAWLWPVDHAHVQLDTLAMLTAALGTYRVAQPRFGDRGGHPPLIARSVWSELAGCADLPEGARTVLRSATTIRVPVDDVGVVRDVDTLGDLAEVV